MLKDLVVSRVRVKILTLLFSFSNKIFHVREIVRQVHEEINAVRRELLHLEKSGIVSKERRANRLYYRLRKDYPLYYEIMEVVIKTTGLGEALLKNRSKLGRVKFALLSGRFVRRLERRNKNEVDVLVVGNVVLPELAQLIKAEEIRIGKEINYTVMSEEEFNFRKSRRDPFITEILRSSKLMVIGDEEELIS